MLFLILAISCSVIIAVILRGGENRVKNPVIMFAANYVVCVACTLIFADRGSTAAQILGDLPGRELRMLIFCGLVGAALFPLSFMLHKRNISLNGVALSSTFMRLGVVIPTVMSAAVFGERLGLMRAVGILIAAAAILVITLEHDSGPKEKGLQAGALPRRNLFWLLTVFLCAGVNDSFMKIFEETVDPAARDIYMTMIFGGAFLVCLAIVMIRKMQVRPMDAAVGLVLGIPNYFSTRFMLLALEQIDGVVAYPVYSVGTIVLTAVVGAVFFRERLSRRQLLGMSMILAALVLLNI